MGAKLADDFGIINDEQYRQRWRSRDRHSEAAPQGRLAQL
jgi:hypothetical protein